FQKARDSSIPMDTIERAVKRGTGELDGVTYEQITYEGYAPGGVAVMAECLTDNRNRTGAEIRNIFSKHGGSMAEPGAVAWQFERKGHVVVPRSVDEDELMMAALDAGADDIADEGDVWRVTTPPTDLHSVRSALEEAGIPVESSELALVSSTVVRLDEIDVAKRVLRLIDALDDHDDIGAVHANFDIPDNIIEAVEA
ncbi:MAG TPA: YebC/PmpR family DNA-binding transcriptional regulator, partial [Acidimicrobiales bacterium]|nr:YebC/PmpR family DNA-binding transcriptional regulator [Acidimicrobiales bacterium]